MPFPSHPPSVTLFWLAFLCAGLVSGEAQEDGKAVIIARTGQLVPTLPDALTTFSAPVLNGSGRVAFIANSSGNAGSKNQVIFLSGGTSLSVIAVNQSPAPTIGGSFQLFTAPVLNEQGTVAFAGQNVTPSEGLYAAPGSSLVSIAGTSGSSPNFSDLEDFAISDTGRIAFKTQTGPVNTAVKGLYFSAGAGATLIANSTQAAVGGITGNFSTFSVPAVNNLGQVAFQATTSTSQQGLYATGGTTLVTVATTQKIAPEIDAAFTGFSEKVAINDSGTVAFSGFSGSKKGIFTGSGGMLEAVATSAPQVHGLAFNFLRFSDPAINNAGTVAFRGTDTTFSDGIYTGNGGALRVIADLTKLAPHLTGKFDILGLPAINGGGTVAFFAAAGSGSGIFLGDGQELIAAAFTGQNVGGSTVTGVSFAGGPDRGGASQFNDNGQVAYNASLANGASSILLFTPTLHYRGLTGGAWSSRANWTVSLQPAAVHDVFIDPASSLTVSGPALPVTVKSLTVNGTGAAVARLALQKAGTLTVLEGLNLGANGVLTGAGKVLGNVASAGSVEAALGSVLTLAGDITGTSLTTAGPGTVNLDGAQNYAALLAGAGTTNVHGAFTSGTARVTASGALNFGTSQTLAALNIGAGGVVTLSASTGFGVAAAPSAVPEPGTVALLAGGSLLLLRRVRRGRVPA